MWVALLEDDDLPLTELGLYPGEMLSLLKPKGGDGVPASPRASSSSAASAPRSLGGKAREERASEDGSRRVAIVGRHNNS